MRASRVAFALSLAVTCPTFGAHGAESVTVIRNVTIIPMTAEIVLPNQTLVIRNGRF